MSRRQRWTRREIAAERSGSGVISASPRWHWALDDEIDRRFDGARRELPPVHPSPDGDPLARLVEAERRVGR